MLIDTQQWERVLEGEGRVALERMLPAILLTRRWFGGKARTIESVRIVEVIPIPAPSMTAVLLFLRVDYREGTAETYALPVAAAFGDEAARIQRESPQAVVTSFDAVVKDAGRAGVLYDAFWNHEWPGALLDAVGRGAQFKGRAGSVIASSTQAYRDLVTENENLTPAVMKAEQSNTSVAFGDRFILKLYRRVQEGVNPDLEIGRVLTAMGFPHTPLVGGAMEYVRPNVEPATAMILQAFVRNQGDAWKFTLDAVEKYRERVQRQPMNDAAGMPRRRLLDLARGDTPFLARELIGAYLDPAHRLGERTAELHTTLAQCRDNPNFVPEPVTSEYRHARYASMCQSARQTRALLERRLPDLPDTTKQDAQTVLDAESAMLDRFRAFRDAADSGLRIRCHGDYHLGQVLWTGQKFMLIDFEGEPARPLSERRLKHPPIMDVAGMLRSFHYAVHAVSHIPHPWIECWYGWVGAEFLKGYLETAKRAAFLPKTDDDIGVLLDAYLLEKAVYECGYELNNRPDWVGIPLRGIAELLKTTG